MGDLTDVRLLYLKGALFVVLGTMAAANLLLLHPEWQVAASLAVCVWAFSRAYYFAFYVIERYVDREYRFAGLSSFVRYLLTR